MTMGIHHLPKPLDLTIGAAAEAKAARLQAELDTLKQGLQRKPRRRPQRVPAQFDKAIKAGLPARLEKRPDGTIVVVVGVDAINEEGKALDNWMAKHARSP